jgi:hypothetical protein
VQQPRTVAEILDRVRATWTVLLATVEGLSDEQLTEPGPPDGWSMKDHFAHIMVWDSVPTSIVRGDPPWVAFGLDQGGYDRIDSVDQLNAFIYERHKDRPLSEVRVSMERVHAELVSMVERLSEAELDRTVADFGGDVDDTRPLRDKIEGDSYGHYAEHTGWLRELRGVLVQEGG